MRTFIPLVGTLCYEEKEYIIAKIKSNIGKVHIKIVFN